MTDPKDSFITADPENCSFRNAMIRPRFRRQAAFVGRHEFRCDLRMSAEAPIAPGETVRRSAAPAC
jgi:hypothetical protein